MMLLTIPLLVEILTSTSGWAPQSDRPILSGSVTITRSLTLAPPELTGRLMIDPVRRTFGPWASVGVGSKVLAKREAYPIGSLGMRFQKRSVWLALGVSGDVAYRSLRTDTLVNHPTPYGTPAVSDVDGSRPPLLPPAAPTRIGYTTQPVADAVATAEWGTRHITLGVETGWRLAGRHYGGPWFSATGAMPLAGGIALMAGIDQRPDRPLLRAPMRLLFGVTWRSTPRSPRVGAVPPPVSGDTAPSVPLVREIVFSVERLPQAIRLRFFAPMARDVETRSDLTGWRSMSLHRAEDGTWQIDLPAIPGIHRLALRVDGGPWLPPPGLSVGSDGYGTAVGLLIIDP